jgi:hypothetical protein
MKSSLEEILDWRVKACLEAVKAFWAAGGDMQSAVAAFNLRCYTQHDETHPRRISAIEQLIRDNVDKLKLQHDMAHGSPALIWNEQMYGVAEMVGSEHCVHANMDVLNALDECLQWCHYSGVREAIMHDPLFSAVVRSLGVDAAYIQEWLHLVDFCWQRTSLPMKDVCLKAVKQQQVALADDLFVQCELPT